MRALICLGLLLAVTPLRLPATATVSPLPPNLVIIFTDDMGYGDVGVFGTKGYRTPNLDRLAAEGGVYRNFCVAAAVCSASRASLLTGCYANRLGIFNALMPRSKVGLAAAETTLAELLQQRGYATAIFGKWHLGDAPPFLPPRHGFDEYFGIPYSNDMWPQHPDLARLPADAAARRSRYPDLPLLEHDRVARTVTTLAEQDQFTTQFTERAVRFIAAHTNRPFFLYLPHPMPHVPLAVSDKFRGQSGAGLYGDVIAEIDWSVGEIMAALRRHQLETNTWVIFTSDNGPWLSYGDHAGSAGPLREGKGTSWEGGIRVPCIMRWPGHIPAGTDSRAMFMTIDLLPTIAARIGAPLPERKIDGRDVWPLIANQPGATNPHAAYWHYYQVNELQAVTSGDGRWKLVFPHSFRTLAGKPGGTNGLPAGYVQRKVNAPELYDLENDPGETTDVAAKHPGVVARLQAEAEKARAELGDALTRREGPGRREPGRWEPPES